MFFKEYFQKKALKKIHVKRVSRYMNLSEIESVGFVFCFEEEMILETIKKLTDILDSKSIKFKAIGINTISNPYPTDTLDYRIKVINKRDTGYFGLPHISHTDEFLAYPFNLYIDFSSSYNFSCDFISRTSKSTFKIGRINYENNPFDLILDNIKEGSCRNYLNAIIHYLSSIRSI